jgi:hypothetical protein
MKLLKRLALFACAVALIGAGCSDDVISNRINGSGIIITEARQLAAFDSIDMRAVGDVEITLGGIQSVDIETDDNIIDHIITTVSNGELIITSDDNYDSVHGVIITVTMTDVDDLELSGVGSIEGQNDFTVDDLTLELDGVGSITVSGTVQILTAELEGVGSIDAEALTAAIATVDISGVGDCYVTATDELNATISGNGDVYYAGDPPVVNSNITGNGSLIQL